MDSVALYGMIDWEVDFDDNFFHHASKVTPDGWHNAYDAEENGTLFRADAIFTCPGIGSPVEVPVFASSDEAGSWRWLVRFRPTRTGNWKVRVRVLCWHPDRAAGDPAQPEDLPAELPYRGRAFIHEFGFQEEDYTRCPEAEARFRVTEGTLPGPLEMPRDGENHYFRRTMKKDGKYERRPFFLLGHARPWVVGETSAVSYLDRDRELFDPMVRAHCNALYHWMAPWETQLVHQARGQWWPQSDGSLRPTHPDTRLLPGEVEKGYRRYDQGRALRTDQVFQLAGSHEILILLSVLTHQSLNEHDHPWHGEHGWGGVTCSRTSYPPSKLNGFQLFSPTPGPVRGTLAIEQFFEMDPAARGPDSWQRRLWKHFANYWRYIIGRWTSYPALGAWVLVDELEGVGTGDNWWWENATKTEAWHDRLVRLIRGRPANPLPAWGAWRGKRLAYTSDYLAHPLTSSTTYYHCEGHPRTPDEAMALMDAAHEISGHGTWQGKDEKIDFVSHHAYQYVPTWGPDSRFTGWALPNSNGHEKIKADRWLWDAMCVRLRRWSDANSGRLRLVTEFGSLERPEENFRVLPWDHYGKRAPTLTHFAYWSGLASGLAGLPFKWNDGFTFGEMATRRGKPPWDVPLYPVDNYAEVASIYRFLDGAALDDLYPEVFAVLKDGGETDVRFRAWGLANSNRNVMLVWIYDRWFATRGNRPARRLRIGGIKAGRAYRAAWYDTWAGADLASPAPAVVRADAAGFVDLRFPAFPTCTRPACRNIADGNDIALRLTAL